MFYILLLCEQTPDYKRDYKKKQLGKAAEKDLQDEW